MCPEVKSLAVLPLKSLNREAGDNYPGLGIADTIIAKVSQAGGLTVRPTSAVRGYAEGEFDSLESARRLGVGSVLDGTFLRSGDRLRVSVNLLRASDGAQQEREEERSEDGGPVPRAQREHDEAEGEEGPGILNRSA